MKSKEAMEREDATRRQKVWVADFRHLVDQVVAGFVGLFFVASAWLLAFTDLDTSKLEWTSWGMMHSFALVMTVAVSLWLAVAITQYWTEKPFLEAILDSPMLERLIARRWYG